MCFAHNVGWFFVLFGCFYTVQKKFPYGDDRFVADPEMFLAPIEDRTHALGGAGIMVEKVLDPRKIDCFAYLLPRSVPWPKHFDYLTFSAKKENPASFASMQEAGVVSQTVLT